MISKNYFAVVCLALAACNSRRQLPEDLQPHSGTFSQESVASSIDSIAVTQAEKLIENSQTGSDSNSVEHCALRRDCKRLGYLAKLDGDYVEAVRYYEFGCRNDETSACESLASLIFDKSFSRDLAQRDLAIWGLERGCTRGDFDVCLLYALFLHEGVAGNFGLQRDVNRSLRLLEHGCSEKHGLSCSHLTEIYELGRGVPIDRKKAREYLKLAEQYGVVGD